MSPWTSPKLLRRKSDAALVAALRDGHEAAFEEIVARYGHRLLRQCRSLLRNGQAEDAVQQTFLRALQALRAGTEVRELGPWLHRIARNVALNELGSRGHDHVELDARWEDSRSCDELDQRARLRAALLAVGALPGRQRAALLQSAAGDPPAAIADRLGVSTVAARQLVHRARVTVRAAVGAVMPPPVLWLLKRAAGGWRRLATSTGMPAGVAPVASKVAVAVAVSAAAAAPAAIIHKALTQRPERRPVLVSSSATRSDSAGPGFSLPAGTIEASIAAATAPVARAEQRVASTPGAMLRGDAHGQAGAGPLAGGPTTASSPTGGDQSAGAGDPSGGSPGADPNASDLSAGDAAAGDPSASDASTGDPPATDPSSTGSSSTNPGSSTPSSTDPSSANTATSAPTTTTDTTSAAPTATTSVDPTATTPTDPTATTPTP